MDIVFEDDDSQGEGYSGKYLEALNIRKIKIADINSLWDKLEKDKYPDV